LIWGIPSTYAQTSDKDESVNPCQTHQLISGIAKKVLYDSALMRNNVDEMNSGGHRRTREPLLKGSIQLTSLY